MDNIKVYEFKKLLADLVIITSSLLTEEHRIIYFNRHFVIYISKDLIEEYDLFSLIRSDHIPCLFIEIRDSKYYINDEATRFLLEDEPKLIRYSYLSMIYEEVKDNGNKSFNKRLLSLIQLALVKWND